MQTILIDWYNLFKACEKVKLRPEAVVGEIVQMGLANGDIQEIRMFIPHYQSYSPWRTINAFQCKFDLAVEACPVLSEKVGNGMEMKDAVDFKVLQWVQTHVHEGIGSDTIIFVTGDGHFLISANVAKRKGKRVEFWFVDPQSLHQLIRRQETCREISLSPPILLTKENEFLDTLVKVVNQELLSDDDKRRVAILVQLVHKNQSGELSLPSSEASLRWSEKLGAKVQEVQQLLEALMALGVARIHPAIHSVIDIDENSPLFQFILPKSGNS